MSVIDEVVKFGADEIALKDMAGVGRPVMLGRLVKAIKDKYPHILVQYHGHSGPGFSVASMLEVAKNGVDIIDVAMEPLAWGMVHPDVITIQAMLKDAGSWCSEINMNAYGSSKPYAKICRYFLWLFYWSQNKAMSSLLIGCGLPGGMIVNDKLIKGARNGINMFLSQC